MYHEQPHIIVSVVNPVDRNLKMNGLRIIIITILNIIVARKKLELNLQFLEELFLPIR